MVSPGKIESLGAIILAGGRSRRMGGRHKALLPLADSTFLEVLVTLYGAAGIGKVLVITHCGVAEDPGFPVLGRSIDQAILDEATESPLHTLWAALDRIQTQWSAFFLHPVDHPYVRAETVTAMKQTWLKEKTSIVQPCFEGRGGHPVLIDMALAGEIRNASPDLGLRQVVRADPSRVTRLAVVDPGVLRGVNRPDQYKAE